MGTAAATDRFLLLAWCPHVFPTQEQAQVKGTLLLSPMLSLPKPGSMCRLAGMGQRWLWGASAPPRSPGDSCNGGHGSREMGEDGDMPLHIQRRGGRREYCYLIEEL